jgi:hypothetical protein
MKIVTKTPYDNIPVGTVFDVVGIETKRRPHGAWVFYNGKRTFISCYHWAWYNGDTNNANVMSDRQ